jgi:hypothetical protein
MNNRIIAAGLLAGVALVTSNAYAIEAKAVAGAEVKKLIDMKAVGATKKSARIAIPGYRVAFVTRNKVSARAEDWLGGVGGGSSSGAKASMEVMLGNIDYAAMQAIADTAYADFVTKMQATGVEIVPLETIKASPQFQKLQLAAATPAKPYTKVLPDGKMHVVIVSPTAIPLWFTNWDGGITDQGMRQGNTKALMAMAKELDAALAFPTVFVDFSVLSGRGNSKFARRASVAAKAAVYVSPVGTLFWSGDYRGFSFARINDGVGADGEPGPFVTGDEASNAGTVKSLMELGIDIGPAKSKKNLVLEADPASFTQLAVEALGGANELYKQAVIASRK